VARKPEVEVRSGASHAEVVRWYRRELARPAVFPWVGCEWEPVRIGPTWQVADKRWVLPDATIGWDVLGWCGTELQHRGQPWRFTLEQARWVLWWFAVDPTGAWLFTDGVLQRLKGWGKDPLAACLLYVEAFGPCRVAYMDGDEPVATDVPEAWVQAAATSLEQTKNTMRLMPSLLSPDARSFYQVQLGKELIHGMGDERLIQAVTSSPATLEGARSTFVERNETQHWLSSNDGHEMAAVIERNNTKSSDGASRALAITNAYEPGEDSVAERDREAFETAEAGRSLTTGILYDSLEAPPDAPLTPDAAPDVVRAVRGDSVWLSPERIVRSIMDTRNPPSRSRRFWYNQITATEDAWVAPQEWDTIAAPDLLVTAGAVVTLGFDGSITDDHSALIGCLVDADHLFEIGVWAPNPNTGEVDRAEIDYAVRDAFTMYDVVGFYSDVHPWESYVDRWAEELGGELCVKATTRQPVAWDMRSRTQAFTVAIERLHDAIVASAIETRDAKLEHREPGSRLTHCGSQRFRQHVHNARRAPNRFGITVRKEHRESARKIDSVPAAALARLARQDYLALPASRRRQKRSGTTWW